MIHSIQAQVCTESIRNNIAAIRRRLSPNTEICAVIKADAYGHGVRCVLPILQEANIERTVVAHLEEGLELRRLGWIRPILCLCPFLAVGSAQQRIQNALSAVTANILCTVTSVAETEALSLAANQTGRRARVEIKIDSGMGRMGFLPSDGEKFVATVARMPQIAIEGIYTHFASSDDEDLTYTQHQLDTFNTFRDRLSGQGFTIGGYHAANSAAVFRATHSCLDSVRPGLALYGYWGGPVGQRPDDLLPAMRIVARLTSVRRVPAGYPIGYGRTFVTSRPSLIGIVPIGYADGYRRLLSNNAVMTLAAKPGQSRRQVPVIGRVSMDQTTVDLTDAGPVEANDEIIVIDTDPHAPNSVEALARKLNTIPYEITTMIGSRIPRVSV
ncbi:MAG: alanine racemase [Phycisphaerales bacterium]|nr:alanine racemase [Phycisphaerales bacterium]